MLKVNPHRLVVGPSVLLYTIHSESYLFMFACIISELSFYAIFSMSVATRSVVGILICHLYTVCFDDHYACVMSMHPESPLLVGDH